MYVKKYLDFHQAQETLFGLFNYIGKDRSNFSKFDSINC